MHLELPFYTYLYFWFRSLTPLVLYYDSTKHNMGRVYKCSVGFWSSLTFLSWFLIPVLPIYLFRRKTLIKQASENPTVRSPARKVISLALLFLFAMAWGYFGVVYPYTSDENKLEKEAMYRQITGISFIESLFHNSK